MVESCALVSTVIICRAMPLSISWKMLAQTAKLLPTRRGLQCCCLHSPPVKLPLPHLCACMMSIPPLQLRQPTKYKVYGLAHDVVWEHYQMIVFLIVVAGASFCLALLLLPCSCLQPAAVRPLPATAYAWIQAIDMCVMPLIHYSICQ